MAAQQEGDHASGEPAAAQQAGKAAQAHLHRQAAQAAEVALREGRRQISLLSRKDLSHGLVGDGWINAFTAQLRPRPCWSALAQGPVLRPGPGEAGVIQQALRSQLGDDAVDGRWGKPPLPQAGGDFGPAARAVSQQKQGRPAGAHPLLKDGEADQQSLVDRHLREESRGGHLICLQEEAPSVGQDNRT